MSIFALNQTQKAAAIAYAKVMGPWCALLFGAITLAEFYPPEAPPPVARAFSSNFAATASFSYKYAGGRYEPTRKSLSIQPSGPGAGRVEVLVKDVFMGDTIESVIEFSGEAEFDLPKTANKARIYYSDGKTMDSATVQLGR